MKKDEKQAKETFSRFVRIRDCIKTTGSPFYGRCFTCGKVLPIESLHCGHFVSGRGNSLFFEEKNSNAQCVTCNTTLGGNLDVYREKLIDKLGLEKVERLEMLRHKPVKITSSEFYEKKNYYTEYINNLTGGV